MKIIDKLIGKFKCNSSKDAYLAAMSDIKAYKNSLTGYKLVGFDQVKHTIVECQSVGGTKEYNIQEFNRTHPNCFKSYTKAFKFNEYNDYFQYLHQLDGLVNKYNNK